MVTTSTILTALERAFAAIRQQFPDVREAGIVVSKRLAETARGYYQEGAWTLVRDGSHTDEIHVSTTILQEGAESVLRTLLHESAHSLARARGVKEVTRQGRYHNRLFEKLANEVGLACAWHKNVGALTPDLLPWAKVTFAHVLADLASALVAYQEVPGQGGSAGAAGKQSQIKLTCPCCGRIIRASAKALEFGPIVCWPCYDALADLDAATFGVCLDEGK